MKRVLGAVLAGGESRRFGSDKAEALLGGRSLIDRVIDRLAPQVDAVVICGRRTRQHAAVQDRPAAHFGPLGGLNAALHHAQTHGYDTVLSVPCDTPGLPEDFAVRLAEAGAPAYLSNLPVIGLWPASLAAVLDRHLATTSDRSIRLWATIAGARPIYLGELANVNTPGDLHRLETSGG